MFMFYGVGLKGDWCNKEVVIVIVFFQYLQMVSVTAHAQYQMCVDNRGEIIYKDICSYLNSSSLASLIQTDFT